MNHAQYFLDKIEKYINDNFDSLVSTPDNMDVYNSLMGIRVILQSELAQIAKAEAQRNSYYAQITRMRDAKWKKERLIQIEKEMNESMKLSQFIPNRCNC